MEDANLAKTHNIALSIPLITLQVLSISAMMMMMVTSGDH